MSLVTTEPEFYDWAMTGDGEPAMLPLDDSPWLELYQQVSWMIPASHPVVDLGCGTGRFAEQLRRRDHSTYHGIDFSPAAVEEARSYANYDGFSFDVADLRDWQATPSSSTTVFICLETLEHLEDDLDLVRRIPVGHEFIFSVPNYGGEAHLRVFQDVSDAWDRYAHLVEFRAWIRVGDGPKNFIHLYRSVRRGDAW